VDGISRRVVDQVHEADASRGSGRLERAGGFLGAAGSESRDTGGEHAAHHAAPNASAHEEYGMQAHLRAHVVGQLAGNVDGSVGSGSAVNVAFGFALRSPTAYGNQHL